MKKSVVPMLLVRHGRTEWNLAQRYQGRSDPPLCPEGVNEVCALAERLRGEPIARILTSPLRRAVTTARMIAEILGLAEPRSDRRLAEMAYGVWEGLTQAEIRQRWPQDLRRWKNAPETMRFPGGENLSELSDRVLSLLAEEAGRVKTASGATLAVTHSGPIRIAALAVARRPLASFRDVPVGPAEVCRLFLHPDRSMPSLRIEEFAHSESL